MRQEGEMLAMLDKDIRRIVETAERCQSELRQKVKCEARTRLTALNSQRVVLEERGNRMRELLRMATSPRSETEGGRAALLGAKHSLMSQHKLVCDMHGLQLEPVATDDIPPCEKSSQIESIIEHMSTQLAGIVDVLPVFRWDRNHVSPELSNFSHDDRTCSGSAADGKWHGVFASTPILTGVHYCAVKIQYQSTHGWPNRVMIGISTKDCDIEGSPPVNLFPAYDCSFASGDTVGVGVDVEGGQITLFVNSKLKRTIPLSNVSGERTEETIYATEYDRSSILCDGLLCQMRHLFRYDHRLLLLAPGSEKSPLPRENSTADPKRLSTYAFVGKTNKRECRE